MSTSENNEQKPVKINGISNGQINENGKLNGIAKDTNAQVKTPTTNGTNSVNGVVAMNSPDKPVGLAISFCHLSLIKI
uniref:Uncharacterized protein n=1 Tax=Meloidogyne enterolobii TaxID=390850 RepID=A0A6V7TQ62_MELEN|nr:unnamed protein product [Meloidogyne enterolobii]